MHNNSPEREEVEHVVNQKKTPIPFSFILMWEPVPFKNPPQDFNNTATDSRCIISSVWDSSFELDPQPNQLTKPRNSRMLFTFHLAELTFLSFRHSFLTQSAFSCLPASRFPKHSPMHSLK